MKIFYVEGRPIHRNCTKTLLEHRNHLVACYLPGESVYGSTKDIPLFQSPEELTVQIAILSPDAVILDRETFSKENNWSGNLFQDYLTPLLQSYHGRILLTTTMPADNIKEAYPECFSPDNKRLKVVEKPHGIEELVSALEK